jgi:hypothetical protein
MRVQMANMMPNGKSETKADASQTFGSYSFGQNGASVDVKGFTRSGRRLPPVKERLPG